MPRPKRLCLLAILDNALDFPYRLGRIEPLGLVLIIARPILSRATPVFVRYQIGEHTAGDQGTGCLQKFSLVHGRNPVYLLTSDTSHGLRNGLRAASPNPTRARDVATCRD